MASTERYNRALEKCLRSITTWKNMINDYVDDSDKSAEVDKLQNSIKSYCLIDNDYKKTQEVIELISHNLKDIEKIEDIDAILQEKINEQSMDDFTSSEIWDRFNSNDVFVRSTKPKEQNLSLNYEAVDDSILCSNTFTPPIDPITKTVIKKPVKNKICGHIYDHNSIYDYLRQSKNKAKCPYIGCKNNKLRGGDFNEDNILKQRIEQYIYNKTNNSSDDED
ncbi:hypothetical protein GWI33_020086 [Rhynchophorus ferrugineus]|uniref:E3 SUMO-protein ligase NSE2 n=1 Tax=Rhynchophorus ferrugineus TaxID=354439 RepID=A0A834M0S4_RHYFE|nr:hypothetical protein GWI33_020086 [Rhynchophorus ferrugineus]